MHKYILFNAVQKIKRIIESKDFLINSRKTETAFTRLRKMPFSDMMYFILGSRRKCVQHELDYFFAEKGRESMSRQAFAKSRENIKPEAIRAINEAVIADFESTDSFIQTFHNSRVFAVDGSVIDLPENEKLRETFGFSTGSNNSSHCKARAMIGFDVLNGICAYGELISFFKSETTHMHEISDHFAKIEAYRHCIFVLDRAYPSLKLFLTIKSNSQYFVSRASMSFYKEIVNTTKPDQLVTIKRKNKQATVRVINFTLTSGLREILVTNLPQSVTYEEIVSLYAKRWGIETNYHYLKNVEMLECFTGESETAVVQDFYASILMLNLAAIAYREQTDILTGDWLKNPKKHNYKPNNKQIICDIKTGFVKMLLAKSTCARAFKQLFLLQKVKRFAYAQVPNRSKPRADPKRHSTLKTHPKSPL